MPYSYASMTNPFAGLPLGKGVLNRAANLYGMVRPPAFTPYRPMIPTAPLGVPSGGGGGGGGVPAPTTGPVQGTPTVAGAAAAPTPTTGTVTGVAPPPGTGWLTPGAQQMLAAGNAIPANMLGLNPANYPNGMVYLTQEQLAGMANPWPAPLQPYDPYTSGTMGGGPGGGGSGPGAGAGAGPGGAM